MANKRNKPRMSLYRRTKLCYPVEEADSGSVTNFARVFSSRADGQNVLTNQGFDIRGRIVHSSQEVSANMNGNCEVGLVSVFAGREGNDYVRGNHFSKVVQDDSSEDFLDNVLPLF